MRATCGRRALLSFAGGFGVAAAAPPRAALALFESAEQVELSKLATAQTKLRGLTGEVAEIKRKRVKMAADFEDDAYVIRFARAVLDQAATSMRTAAPAVASERGPILASEFKAQVEALIVACRANDAGAELDALTAAEKALAEFLELAAQKKYNVKPKEDINGYEGASGLLYNKFIFRSG